MDPPCILSLDELRIKIPEDVLNHICSIYTEHYRAITTGDCDRDADANAKLQANGHVERLLQAMKTPPSTSIVRLNRLEAESMDDVVSVLKKSVLEWISERLSSTPESSLTEIDVAISPHEVFDDVITIRLKRREETALSQTPPSLRSSGECQVPPDDLPNGRVDVENSTMDMSSKERHQARWPVSHKVIICDRFCGEAVLRGSDIFVRGVLCAEAAIQTGDTVAVYVDLSSSNPTRGLNVDKYSGKCVFLGLGKAACPRRDFFRLQSGAAVYMSPLERADPILPPLSSVPGLLQNLPSILVAHALSPQPDDVILDMCAAPGGKTSHLASLVGNRAVIVACDRSKSKIATARAMFQDMGATCISAVAVDSTRLVAVEDNDERKSVSEILAHSDVDQYGLHHVSHFPPESFDRILLDPPCSALGLRPKLRVDVSLTDLEFFAKNQKRLIRTAVALLKPGGTLTYSTCTINTAENEGMVRHILDTYPGIKLEKIDIPIGSSGLAGAGLVDDERSRVRRFDPTHDVDTIGFFLATFVKR